MNKKHGLINKLFFEKDKETGEKKIDKIKIGWIATFVFIIVFAVLVINPALHQNDALLIQNSIYNYLPEELSAYEKVDYVLEEYGYFDELRFGGYSLWVEDSGAKDKWYSLELFNIYDINHNGRLNKTELTNFIRDTENFQNYAEQL